MKYPLLLVGDSHSAVYVAAAREKGMVDRIVGGPIAGARTYDREFFLVQDGQVKFDKASTQERFNIVAKTAGVETLFECQQRLVLSLGLAAAPLLGDLAKRKYEFGSHEKLPKNWRYLTSNMLNAIIEDAQKHIVRFFEMCIERNLLVAAIAGPPPQRRHRAVKFYDTRVFELIRMFEAPVRKVLDAAGCPIIQVENVTDPEGFLLDQYWGADWAHGSVAYGGLVCDELLAVVASRNRPQQLSGKAS